MIETLNTFKNPSIDKNLYSLLLDPNPNIVYAVIEGLILLRIPESIPHLLSIISNHDEPALRIAAINAVGKIGSIQELNFFRNLLNDPDPMILFAAIDTIGNIGDPSIVDSLLQLYPDAYPLIQEMIFFALKHIGDRYNENFLRQIDIQTVKNQLLTVLQGDDFQLKTYALEEIDNILDKSLVKPLLPLLLEENLQQKVETILLHHRDTCFPIIRNSLDENQIDSTLIAALIRVLTSGYVDGFEQLCQKFYCHADYTVRTEIALGMGKLSDPLFLPLLQELIHDEIGHVRRTAANAVGWGHYVSLVPELFDLLEDNYIDVQEAAMGSLVLIGNSEIIQRFVHFLNHAEMEKRLFAIKALSWIGEKEVIPYLEETLVSSQKELRKISIESLVRMNSRTSAPIIIQCLYDEDHQNRQAAIQALALFRHGAALEHVVALLHDPNMWVRYVAAKNLLLIDDVKGVAHIREILAGEDDIAILGALQGLFDHLAPELIPYIELLAEHDNNDIRANALRLLSHNEETC